MFKYKASSCMAFVAILLASYSTVSMSFIVHQYPTDVYASNTSCNQTINLTTCENQQNVGTSSDNKGSVKDNGNDFSASNTKKDEIPILIPDISPTVDNNEGDESDYGSSGQGSSDNGGDDDDDNAANGRGGSNRDSKGNGGNDASDDGDESEPKVPSLLPFP